MAFLPAAAAIIGPVASVAGAVGGFQQSRSQAKAASRAGTAAANRAGAAVAQSQSDLEFARAQFEQFRPAIQQVSGFFEQFPLEAVFDDEGLAQQTESATTAANQLATAQTRGIQQNIAQRGLAGSGIAAQELVRPEQARQQSLVDIRNSARQQQLADRLAFAGLGQGASQNVLSAGGQASQILQGQALSQANQAGQLSSAAQASAAGAGSSLVAGLRGLSGSNINTFKPSLDFLTKFVR